MALLSLTSTFGKPMKVTLMRKTVGSDRLWMPMDEKGIEITGKFSDGDVVVVDIKKHRNPHFHRYAFAMMNELYNMVDADVGFDRWRQMLTIKAGYFVPVGSVDVDGTVRSAVYPTSLSFENMDEIEFQECMAGIHQAFIDKYGSLITYDKLSHAVGML